MKTNQTEYLFFPTIVIKPEKLREALLPTWERMFMQQPESIEFRQPKLMGIRNYLEILQNPLDLSMIQFKLNCAQYLNPWEYVDDVKQMLYNAKLYNKETSKVSEYSTNVRLLIVHNQKCFFVY